MARNALTKLAAVGRLANVGVGVQVVGLKNILIRLGRSQNHHRYPFKLRILLDVGEHLATLFVGQIQV